MANRDFLKTIIAIIVVFTIVFGGYMGLKNASGVNPPSTVIESESMQHGNESKIGIIDTGDLIVVKSPMKTQIVTFVEGYQNDYQTFGDYGSVIVYKRSAGNPVIHRAIVYLEYNESTNKWSSKDLMNYPSEYWTCDSGNDYTNITGTLKITKLGSLNPTVTIDMNKLIKKSGYITMGDNNSTCDQSCGIALDTPISKDRIKSVAWVEIPWIGSIKMIMAGEINQINNKVPNTIPCLAASFVTMFLTIISIGFIIDEFALHKRKKKL